MRTIDLQTKEVTLQYYPEFKDYLSQFKDPMIGLVGDYGRDQQLEQFLVIHGLKGVHTFVQVPNLEGHLSFHHLKELYRSENLTDYIRPTWAPIGYGNAYECFIIIDGGGIIGSCYDQPHLDGGKPIFTIGVNFDGTSTYKAGMNMQEFDSYDHTTKIALANCQQWDEIFHKIGANANFKGGIIYTTNDKATKVITAYVTKTNDEATGEPTYHWTCYTSGNSAIEVANAVISDNNYQITINGLS